jgi:IMP dehydrogenase
MDLDDAARVLFRYGLRNVPVINDRGMLIGIISNLDVVRSHIERATPNKVLMVKTFLEKKHGITIVVKRRVIPIDELRPTQWEVFADELLGRQEEIKRGLVEPIIVVQKRDYYLLVDGHHRFCQINSNSRQWCSSPIGMWNWGWRRPLGSMD